MQDLERPALEITLITSETLKKRIRNISIAISSQLPLIAEHYWTGTAAPLYIVRNSSHGLFRKEVIQPQVLLRLPCYDFTPIMSHTLGRCLPCGLACRLLVQPTFVM